jgi:hypothetical protein
VIVISILPDNCTENVERFSVALRNPTDGALLCFNRAEEVRVFDNTAVGLWFCLTERLPNGQIRLTLNTVPSRSYSIEASTNLMEWINLATRTASGWSHVFTDTNAPSTQSALLPHCVALKCPTRQGVDRVTSNENEGLRSVGYASAGGTRFKCSARVALSLPLPTRFS